MKNKKISPIKININSKKKKFIIKKKKKKKN